MTHRDLFRIAAVMLLAVVLLPAIAAACPLCADAKSNTDYPGGSASLPKGFYYSILFMVIAPFAVVGGFILRIFVARRRARTLPVAPGKPVVEAPLGTLLPETRGSRS